MTVVALLAEEPMLWVVTGRWWLMTMPGLFILFTFGHSLVVDPIPEFQGIQPLHHPVDVSLAGCAEDDAQ